MNEQLAEQFLRQEYLGPFNSAFASGARAFARWLDQRQKAEHKKTVVPNGVWRDFDRCINPP